MASVLSEESVDQLSDRFEFDGYSLSADVSESESSNSSFSCLRVTQEGEASSSLVTSPFVNNEFSDESFSPAKIPIMSPVIGGRHAIIPPRNVEKPEYADVSEVEMMKQRFSKLLLGEDMSGGGKGVCTALAISNAITNLSASMFGKLWKLEPLPSQKKSMWVREMDWLLSVSNSIVELIPSLQDFPGGGTFEVMVPRPRSDLYMNLPALKKLDDMLLSILDGFQDSEFYYVDRGVIFGVDEADNLPPSSPGRQAIRQEEKWWLPFPRVQTNGLSADTRKRLEQCRECANQILKAAMAINSNVLAEMEIPSAYSENLPKSGKECLGEMIYQYLTARQFSPESLLDYLDLSSEYTTLEVANRIESAAHVWRQKYQKRHFVRSKNGKSSWGGKVKGFVGEIQRNMLLAKRAETLLHKLRLRFPGLPQTALDMSKIQYNKDVGHAIIESYSRVLESLAFNIMGKIEDLLYVDDATKQRAAEESEMRSLYQQNRSGAAAPPKQKIISNSRVSIEKSSSVSSYKKSTSDSSNELVRMLNRKTHRSLNKNNQRGTLDQTLEKLTF